MDIAITIHEGLLLQEKRIGDASAREDRKLLNEFSSGNRDAFDALYQRHSRAVFQFALYMAGDADKADEITQQVFVWLLHHPGAFDPDRGSLAAFLGGVAHKFFLRALRAQKKWLSLEDAVALVQMLSFSKYSATTGEFAYDTGKLRQAIASLPVRYREAVVICELQEKSYLEAAAILGCSVGTIRSRLHRGRALLTKKLQGVPRKEEK